MLEEIEAHRSFGGWQRTYRHTSRVLGCEMRFGLFLPSAAHVQGDRPVLYFLSGLTCTEENASTKSGLQAWCNAHGLIAVFPDTSPRGVAVADDPRADLGQGAGFYLTATQAPWAAHYRMDAYVAEELPDVLSNFTTSERRGVTGHSMGGHGALTLALRHPDRYQSVSAFAPILNPSAVPWGQRAFAAYLGEDRSAWARYDATELLAMAKVPWPILIDQGGHDPFLHEQLGAERFLAAAEAMGTPVSYQIRDGYDHSYYFVATFAEAHVRHHAEALGCLE